MRLVEVTFRLLIRLLSLFEYMLEDSVSAENKEILLFSHDKLLLASIQYGSQQKLVM